MKNGFGSPLFHRVVLRLFRYHSIPIHSSLLIQFLGRVEQYVPSGPATRVDTGEYCTSLIDHVLDYHIINMKFERYFDRVLGDYMKKTGDPRCVNEEVLDLLSEETSLYDQDDDSTTSLSMYEMAGIFIVHAGFCVLALLLALFKFYRDRKEKVHSSLRNMIEIGNLRRPKENESSGTALGGETVITSDGETPKSVDPCSGLEPVSEGREHPQSHAGYDEAKGKNEEISFLPLLMRDQTAPKRQLSV